MPWPQEDPVLVRSGRMRGGVVGATFFSTDILYESTMRALVQWKRGSVFEKLAVRCLLNSKYLLVQFLQGAQDVFQEWLFQSNKIDSKFPVKILYDPNQKIQRKRWNYFQNSSSRGWLNQPLEPCILKHVNHTDYRLLISLLHMINK